MRTILAAAACLAIATPALARDPDLVSVGVGGTDILNQARFSAVDFRLEFRSGISLLPYFENYVKVKPWAGVEVTSRSSIWTGAGIWLDVPLGQHWVLSPSFGAGYYDQGRGKPLGSIVEFRSTMEGGYVFDNGLRLVASFGHISNAGLTKRNPGTENAVVSVQMPISAIVGALGR